MVHGCHQHAAFLAELPMLPGDLEILPYQLHGRNAPQAHNDLGPQKRHLPPQIADAGVLFHIQRIPVLGRTALDDVGDVHRLPLQADHFQHIIQQLPGGAHEGHALCVLVGPGSLTDEQDLRLSASHAEHHIFPRPAQGAGLAVFTFGFQFFPFGHGFSSLYFQNRA